MEVILREDVEKLGNRGEVVKVAAGYARNFLLPQRLAVAATESNKKIVDQERQAWLKREAKAQNESEDLSKLLDAQTVTITQRAGENDQLFGSVTAKDLADALEAQGFNIDRRKILLEEPIRSLGDFIVPVRLHRAVTANLKVSRRARSLKPVSFELTGQVAIVTGAATGIGAAIARRLAGAGALVGIADLDLAGASDMAGSINGAFPLVVDITNSDEVNAAVAKTIAEHGRIDILVNNAGVAGKSAPAWEYTDREFTVVVNINLNGTFYFSPRRPAAHARTRLRTHREHLFYCR